VEPVKRKTMQKLLAEYRVTAAEKRKYVFDEKRDFEILEKCRRLEKQKISSQDRKVVRLIKTQLEKDWRSQLLVALNKLLRKNAPTRTTRA